MQTSLRQGGIGGTCQRDTSLAGSLNPRGTAAITSVASEPQVGAVTSVASEPQVGAVTRAASKKLMPEIKTKSKEWATEQVNSFPQRPLTANEKLILLHRRMGHVNMRKLVDSFMRMRFTGYTIPRLILLTLTLP